MPKKKPSELPILFEAPETVPNAVERNRASEAIAREPDEVYCPNCGVRAARSAHPQDHDGDTHYCISGKSACVEFYFTPKIEEAAEKTLVIAEEVSRGESLPTVTEISEPNDGFTSDPVRPYSDAEQNPLFATGEKWEDAWKGMPEFVQEDLAPFKSIAVHFASRSDMDEFSRLIGQKVLLTTRSIWFPEAEIGRRANKRYVGEK